MKRTLSLRSAFVAFESRNFSLFFIGQFISQLGTWMQNIAQGWLAYKLTGSISLLATINFLSLIPTLVITPFVGVIIDRVNRLIFLKGIQVLLMLQAFTIAILSLSDIIQVWHLLVLSIILGLLNACERPLRLTLITDFVQDKNKINNAIALNSVLMNSTRLIGPSIAGILIALIGESYCFLLNGISYIAVIIGFYMMDYIYPRKKVIHQDILAGLQEGYQYIKKSFPLKILLMQSAALGFFLTSIIGLLPAYVKRVLSGDSYTLGYISTTIGIGAVCAALYLAFQRDTRKLPKLISIASFSGSIGLILLGLLQIHIWVYIVSIMLGFGMIAGIASCNTMLQTIADERKKGRVISFYSITTVGFSSIAILAFGYLAEQITISYTFIIQGILMLIIAIIYENLRLVFTRFSRIVISNKYRK